MKVKLIISQINPELLIQTEQPPWRQGQADFIAAVTHRRRGGESRGHVPQDGPSTHARWRRRCLRIRAGRPASCAGRPSASTPPRARRRPPPRRHPLVVAVATRPVRPRPSSMSSGCRTATTTCPCQRQPRWAAGRRDRRLRRPDRPRRLRGAPARSSARGYNAGVLIHFSVAVLAYMEILGQVFLLPRAGHGMTRVAVADCLMSWHALACHGIAGEAPCREHRCKDM